VLCVLSSEWEVAFIGKEGWWSAGGHITGAAGSVGAVGAVMCRLSPWTPLIAAPEVVVGRLHRLVSLDT
jgi:hypothetical protein